MLKPEMNLLCIATVGLLVISGVAGQTNSTSSSAEPTAAANTTTAETTTTAHMNTTVETTTTAHMNTTVETTTTALMNTTKMDITTTAAATTVSTTVPVITTTAPQRQVSYVVGQQSGNTTTVCIVFNGTTKFTLPYKTVQGMASVDYYLPPRGLTNESKCETMYRNATGQLLRVTNFYEDWSFELFFENNTDSYMATKLRFDYQVKNSSMFPNADGTYPVTIFHDGSFNQGLFASVKIPGYYMCNADTTVSLGSTLANTTSSATFTGLSMFAYGNQNNANPYGGKIECSTDNNGQTDYIVPIIVGCVLAAIILIVLVAYIIGRYRSRNTYQSV